MPTTLAYGATTITLHDDLLWTDEFSTWQAQTIRTSRTIAGSLIVESAAQVKGRPITLSAGEDHGWLSRAVVAQLAAAADIPGQKFTLTLRGVAYTVQFSGPVKAEPVVDYSDPGTSDFYVVTLPFIEVEA